MLFMCLATGFYINAWYAISLHLWDSADMSSARRVKSVFLRHGICTMKRMPSISLHLTSDQFLRWGFMVIFWNLASVPFVGNWFTWLLNDPDSLVALYIFRCIHGIARARELPFLDNRILHPLRHTPDGLLRVCASSLLANVDVRECNVAGTLAWHKRVISRCRLKGSTNSAKHSPSSPGIRYRTLTSIKTKHG